MVKRKTKTLFFITFLFLFFRRHHENYIEDRCVENYVLFNIWKEYTAPASASMLRYLHSWSTQLSMTFLSLFSSIFLTRQLLGNLSAHGLMNSQGVHTQFCAFSFSPSSHFSLSLPSTSLHFPCRTKEV
jgi:hypothetical protein